MKSNVLLADFGYCLFTSLKRSISLPSSIVCCICCLDIFSRRSCSIVLSTDCSWQWLTLEFDLVILLLNLRINLSSYKFLIRPLCEIELSTFEMFWLSILVLSMFGWMSLRRLAILSLKAWFLLGTISLRRLSERFAFLVVELLRRLIINN